MTTTELSTSAALNINDTARRMALGRTTVYGLIREGRLRALKVGTRTLVRVSEIERFLDELERERSA